jgi:hypothetical protein
VQLSSCILFRKVFVTHKSTTITHDVYELLQCMNRVFFTIQRLNFYHISIWASSYLSLHYSPTLKSPFDSLHTMGVLDHPLLPTYYECIGSLFTVYILWVYLEHCVIWSTGSRSGNCRGQSLSLGVFPFPFIMQCLFWVSEEKRQPTLLSIYKIIRLMNL